MAEPPTQRGRPSLRRRIILWSLLPAMAILAAVAGYASLTYYAVTEDQIMERNLALTQLQASKLATDLIDYVDLLDQVAQTSDMASGLPALQSHALRAAIPTLRVFDAGVVFLDSSGTVVAADARRLDAVGMDWSDRSIFYPLHQVSRYPICSSIEDVPFEDTPQVIAIMLPVRGQGGAYIGVLAGLFGLAPQRPGSAVSELNKTLGRIRANIDASVYVVDASGQAINAAFNGTDITATSSHPAIAAVLRGDTGALRTVNPDGEQVIASYAPVPDTPWGLVQEEDWDALVAPIAKRGRYLLALLGLGLLLPLLVIAIGMRRITGPVADLTEAASQMADGELEHTIEVPSDEELADLAMAFNRMSAQLRDLYRDLERKVADRTRELATLNSVADVVSRSLDTSQILTAALERILAALGLAGGAAYEWVATEGTWRTVVRLDVENDTAARIRDALPDAAAQTEFQGSQTRSLDDIPDGALRRALSATGAFGAMVLPLSARQRILGMIVLKTSDNALAGENEALLASIAQQVGVALENARLYDAAQVAAAAAERSRLAAELHDSVTQTLFSANLIAGVLPLLWESNPDQAQQRLAELQQLTQGALAEMRSLLLELRPAALAETPLADLLRQLGDAAAGRARITVCVEADRDITIANEAKTALYRIAQESLSNATKHAGASRIDIILRAVSTSHTGHGGPTGICMSIADNGRGFDPSEEFPGHLGLQIMRERAEKVGASLAIESAPEQGTIVTVTVPPAGPTVAQ